MIPSGPVPPTARTDDVTRSPVSATALSCSTEVQISAPPVATTGTEAAFNSAQYNATLPPWSAAHAYTNLYGPKAAEKTVMATVVSRLQQLPG